MPYELLEDLERHRRYVRSEASRLRDVDGVPEARRKNLGVVALDDEYLADVGDQPEPVRGDVVKPTHKRGNDVSPRLGGQDRLRRRERERDVDLDAVVRQLTCRPEAVRGQRDLDDRVVCHL